MSATLILGSDIEVYVYPYTQWGHGTYNYLYIHVDENIVCIFGLWIGCVYMYNMYTCAMYMYITTHMSYIQLHQLGRIRTWYGWGLNVNTCKSRYLYFHLQFPKLGKIFKKVQFHSSLGLHNTHTYTAWYIQCTCTNYTVDI